MLDGAFRWKIIPFIMLHISLEQMKTMMKGVDDFGAFLASKWQHSKKWNFSSWYIGPGLTDIIY